jgi:hypothetical protein
MRIHHVAVLPEHFLKEAEGRVHERPSAHQTVWSRRFGWSLRRNPHLWRSGQSFRRLTVRI